MNTRTQTIRKTQTAAQNLDLVLSDAISMAEGAMSKALDSSAQKMALDSREAVVNRLQRNDPAAVGYVYYSLANQAAEWLGAWDESVKAVYLYDADALSEDGCFDEAVRSPLLHLIVWASRKTGALVALLDVLDRALVQAYADLTGKSTLKHILSAEVIDDDSVQNSIGCAALLRSVHTRPLRVWER